MATVDGNAEDNHGNDAMTVGATAAAVDTINPADAVLLEALNISVQRDRHQLLRDVSLQIKPGRLTGLIGPNGAGKSTLLAVLAGLADASAGAVNLHGKSLATYADRKRAREIGWLEQLNQVHWPVSVEYIVMLGRIPYLTGWQAVSESDKQIVEQVMRDSDLLALRERSVDTLSGGEFTRVMLARTLAARPRVLLADEPVAALDPGHQLQTMEMFRRFSDDKANATHGCLVTLHDLSLAARYCDDIYLLHQGRMVASGKPADVLTSENIRHVYGVDVISGFDQVPWIVPVRSSASPEEVTLSSGDNGE